MRDLVAGALGGLAGGVAVSAMMLGTEWRSGTPSELVKLGRKTAEQHDAPHRRRNADPDLGEQALSHGGHLALSAAAGALYPALRHATGLPTVPAGLLFGLGFYLLAWGGAGPALSLTPTPVQEGPAKVGQRLMIHAVFGTVTAFVADRLAKRL